MPNKLLKYIVMITVMEYVKSKNAMGINEWLKEIEKDGLIKFENLIIRCADDSNKIIINHDANFNNVVNI